MASLTGTVATPLFYVSSTGALTLELLTDSSNSNLGFSLECTAFGDSFNTMTTPTSTTSSPFTPYATPSTPDSRMTTPSTKLIGTTPFSTTESAQPVTVSVATVLSTVSTTELTSSEIVTSSSFTDSDRSSSTSQARTSSTTVSFATEVYSTEDTSAVPTNAEFIVTGSPVTGSPVTDSPVTDSPVTGSPEGTPLLPESTLAPPEILVNSTETGEVSAVVVGVVSEVVTLLQELINETSQSYIASKVQGRLEQFPLESCQDLASVFEVSGYYWLRSANGSLVQVFCDMSGRFGGRAGYMRVADMDMTRPADNCPATLQPRTDLCDKRLCGRGKAGPGCSVVTYSTHGIPYQRVCGRVLAYQIGSPNGFFAYHLDPSVSLSEAYVDGVSLTWGSAPSGHIWTFAAAANASMGDLSVFSCSGHWPLPSDLGPGFVDGHYFCDGLSEEGGCVRPLWSESGSGLDGSSSGQTSMSRMWFCVELGQTVTEDVQLRVCGNEDVSNEDTPLETVMLYVQ